MIELHRFQLVEGCPREDFLSADELMQQEFSYQQPGLLRRTTARGDDGEWLVIELWSSEDAADRSDTRSRDDAVAQKFAALIDQSTVWTARYAERG